METQLDLIHKEAFCCAKDYLNSERALLSALLKVDETRAFEKLGFTYLTPYCVHALALSEDIAKCLVRVVRKSHDVPELARSVIAGEISLYKARVLTSVITPNNKSEWLEMAKSLSKLKLERAVSEINGVNTKRIHLDMPFDTVERLERAREILSSKSAAFASFEATIDWALEEVVSRHDPIEKAKRARGSSVKHEVTRRDLETCQYIFDNGSQCSERKWLDRHHVVHKSHGGEDSLENLVTLCKGHHRMLHARI